MTLLSAADVRALAARLDVRPTKTLGQNFVIDPNTVRKIVRTAEVGADDVVVEVGPGLGSLTLGLLEVARRVVAVEIDPVLAAEKGIVDGEWMVIETPRAEIEARAKVTNRVRPLRIGDRTVHQVCLPWHWGTYRTNEQGVVGDSANDLVAISGDPNVSIHESKAFRCSVRAGRRRGESTERLAGAESPAQEADPGSAHPAERPDRGSQTDQAVFAYGGENREI